jgi:signal transduction histidine kinase
MLIIVPEWAHHYGEFWRAIRIRNLWFIRLRYFAAILLFGFVVIGDSLLNFQLTGLQVRAVIITSVLILLYNITLHSVRKDVGCVPGKFNCMHLSLIQIMLDLISLMVVVYYTGVIESPLYMFFIFHMIIGSLILPGYIVYVTASIISLSFAALAMFQRYKIVETHIIHGLYTNVRPQVLTYDIFFIISFTFMLFVSVFIANKIARQLYQREQQLRLTVEKVKELEISKQKYTMGVVHEIKTPVTAVMSLLDLVYHGYVGPISEEVKAKVERAKARGEETLELINSVLRISKLKLLNIKSTEEINIVHLLQKIIEKHAEVSKTKNIHIELRDLRNNQKIIKADPLLLDLAFSNIINNSIKYNTQDGHVEISIEGKESHLILRISDDGIGIPPEEKEKIFEQFYRASNVNKGKVEGSGMGLALVKEIIERHNGVIRIESPSPIMKKGKPGTCVVISLPYETIDDTANTNSSYENYL